MKELLVEQLSKKESFYCSFPYPLPNDSQLYEIHLRFQTFGRDFQFSLDLTEKERIKSIAWLDCQAKTRAAFVCFNCPTLLPDSPEFFRNGGNLGLFVDEKIRRKGVASSLISYGRMILDMAGVPLLIINGVKDIQQPDSASWSFYKTLNPHVLASRCGLVYYNGQSKPVNWGGICLPTKATVLRPYSL